MPTRRAFLQSALFLPAALTHAQPPQAPNNPITPSPTFDFEGGNWNDWTIEGEAFGARPATDALFPGKIRGFGGNGFVCTLHPRKGNAAVGKAVSREFTIEKPFLTFKIGGGNHPHRESGNQACLNLVVDSQIVRTATGDGTPNLSESSWDVSPLLGKKARLEIVDNTASENRGYILVDDIQFTERPPMRPQRVLERYQITPTFLPYSRFFRDSDERLNGRWLPFGVSEQQFDAMIDSAYLMMCDSRYRPYSNISVDEIAGFVKQVAGEVSKNSPSLSELGQKWLRAEVVCAWALLYIERDVEMDKAMERNPKINNIDLAYPRIVLQSVPPKAQCAGYSLVVRDLARKVGLTTYILQGTFRSVFGGGGGHCWTVFHFGPDLQIPADATTPCTPEEVMHFRGKVRDFGVLPRKREEWELYHAMYYNWSPIKPNIVLYSDPKESIPLLNLTEQQWNTFNVRIYAPFYNSLTRRKVV